MANHPPKDPSTLGVPNGAPLVDAIADQVRKVRATDPFCRIAVITPSIFSAFFLRRAVTAKLCQADETGLFNVEFMRMEEVVDRLFDATPGRPVKPSMTRLVASELIYNAMVGLATQGPLTEHVNNESALNAIQNTLQELERLDIGTGPVLSRLSAKATTRLYAQLKEIHQNYSASATEFLTRENKAAIASETALTNAETVDAALASHIVLLRAPIPPDAYSRLRDRIQDLPSTITVTIDPELGVAGEKTGSGGATRFYSTLGLADEPRALIRNIAADARAGIRFGEMAVLYTSSDYAARVKDALRAAGIESCGPTSRTVIDTPAGRFLQLFLNMVAGEMRRDEFTDWTSSAPVTDPGNGDRVPSVPWEVATRNANVSRFSGDDRWQRSLNRYSKSLRNRAKRAELASDEENAVDPESMRALADAASQLVQFVQRLNPQIDVETPRYWSGWVDWLERIVDTYLARALNAEDATNNGIDRVRAILSDIRELEGIGRTDVEFSRFSRTVQRSLRTSLGGDPGWGTAVLVAPLSAGIGNSFRSVHILGMAEGSLPAPTRSDPLLPDELRLELDPGGSRLPTKSDHIKFERSTFQLALQTACNRNLYWNRAQLGATNESYPSPWFVDEVVRFYGLTSVPVRDLMAPKSEFVEAVAPLSDRYPLGADVSSEYEFRLREVAVSAPSEAAMNRLLADPLNRPLSRGNSVNDSKRRSVFGDHDGNVADVRRSSKFNLQTSASALQNYAECPYRYFLATELNVDERIDPEESLTLSALDKGILVHSILERFLKESGPDQTSEGLKRLREVAYAEFDRFQREDYFGYPAIFDLEKDQIWLQLEQWHRSNMDVLFGYEGEMMTEVPFGFSDAFGRIVLDDGFAFQFRGKIDLIALSHRRDQALVVDFKTGRSSRYSDVEKDITGSGTKLQLPLYARVASEILKNHADVDAAYWFVFENGGTRLRPKIPASLESTDAPFNQVLNTVIGGIRIGAFPARPGQRDTWGDGPPWKNCKYCAYSTVCSANRSIEWERKKSSSTLADYVTLAEGETS